MKFNKLDVYMVFMVIFLICMFLTRFVNEQFANFTYRANPKQSYNYLLEPFQCSCQNRYRNDFDNVEPFDCGRNHKVDEGFSSCGKRVDEGFSNCHKNHNDKENFSFFSGGPLSFANIEENFKNMIN